MDFTKLFCDCDDFIKLNSSLTTKRINHNNKRKYTPRSCKLSSSEVITICIAFHQSGYRNFKIFYLNYVIKYLSGQFTSLVSYSRFVVLMRDNLEILAAFLQSRFDKATGISFLH